MTKLRTTKQQGSQGGFSLIEMMVAVVIGGIMIAGITTVSRPYYRSSHFPRAQHSFRCLIKMATL